MLITWGKQNWKMLNFKVCVFIKSPILSFTLILRFLILKTDKFWDCLSLSILQHLYRIKPYNHKMFRNYQVFEYQPSWNIRVLSLLFNLALSFHRGEFTFSKVPVLRVRSLGPAASPPPGNKFLALLQI